MSKALFTYTTEIAAAKTIAEIEAMLARAGASVILKEYAPAQSGVVSAVSFKIKTEFGVLPVHLPARADDVLLALRKQAAKEAIPSRWVTPEQADRVAWRVVFHWLQAQLAMIEVGNARLEQVMLPYVQTSDEARTFYEVLREKRFALGGITLALPTPEKGAA